MKILPLGNSTIECSQKQEAYNTLRLKYQSLADNAKNDFLAKFEQQFKDMDELHVKFSQVAKTYLETPIDIAIRDLVEIEVFDVDDEFFLKKYLSPHISLEEGFGVIDDKYMEIVLKAEELEAYRQASRSNSSGVMGGGFGVEGAVTGVAAATAVNLFLGAVGGAINAGSKSLSALGDEQKKSKLYNSPDTREHLANIIRRLTFQTHFAYIDAIREYHPEIEFKNVPSENIIRSKAILKNLHMGRITAEKIENNLIDALRLNPYDFSLYTYWVDSYGDSDGNLEGIAQFYGVRELSEYKKKLFLKNKETLNFDTLEEFTSSLGSLKKYAQSIGFQCGQGKGAKLSTPAEQVDEDIRTVGGITFDTYEDAFKAKHELELNKRMQESQADALPLASKMLLSLLESESAKHNWLQKKLINLKGLHQARQEKLLKKVGKKKAAVSAREERIIRHLKKNLNRMPTEKEIEQAKWDGVEL